MKANSGTSKHFVKENEKDVLSSMREDNCMSVVLPNKMELNSNIVGTLPLSSTLTSQAVQANILPGMTNNSLLSIGQLCDDNCIALFHKKISTYLQRCTTNIKG